MVESEDLVQPLIDWGIAYGQGYLFGQPNTQIEGFEGGRPSPPITVRRKGMVETWE